MKNMKKEFNLSEKLWFKGRYIHEEVVRKFIKWLKKRWREKARRMEIMSGDVAIFELESLIKECAGEKLI